ncbi:hypothetical protein HMPREF9722_02514 [Treponema denticola ATCC 33520]|nr:hypothetical protein HMPREF9722_02514 [Treponema denticola ATCC 33520]
MNIFTIAIIAIATITVKSILQKMDDDDDEY